MSLGGKSKTVLVVFIFVVVGAGVYKFNLKSKIYMNQSRRSEVTNLSKNEKQFLMSSNSQEKFKNINNAKEEALKKRSVANEDTNVNGENLGVVRVAQRKWLEAKRDQSLKKSKMDSAVLNKFQRSPLELHLTHESDKWSIFPDLVVRAKLSSDEVFLFSIGAYEVGYAQEKENKAEKNELSLAKVIFDENQKIFSILTGRIVVKVNDLFLIEQLSKDYDLETDSLNSEIKTVFFKAQAFENLKVKNIKLNQDSRVSSARIEVVRGQWELN